MAGRNGEISLVAGSGNIVTEDNGTSFCVYKENNTDSFITVKNYTNYNLTLFYYLIYIE